MSPFHPTFFRSTKAGLAAIAFGFLATAITSCSGDDGSTGPQGPPGPPGDGDPTSTEVERDDDAPGLNVTILSLGGASGAGGAFQVGDHFSVTFTLTKDDGSAWQLSEMTTARMMVSGPSFNYQRVLPRVNDVATASVENVDGSFTYTFADPIPATYAAPLGDSPTFGLADGELTGENLLSGTYTVGGYFAWEYTVEGETFRDAGNVTQDFLFGSATVIDEREVVKQDNCNACHTSLRAHGFGERRDVKLCLLCHTAGSEDANDPALGGGTPNTTLSFKVMIHKLHNGAHLPSVLGISANDDGSIDYAATPVPYLIAESPDGEADFSEVNFPVWPNLNIAMPKDAGYSLLSSTDPDGTGPLLSPRARNDRTRTGVTACAKCHGDPDASGPLTAPADGALYKTQPTEQACYACHDDVRPGYPYTQNQQTMPDTANNSNCVLCHTPSGAALSVEDAHKHPLENSAIDAGVVTEITGVSGGSGPGGNFQVGDTPTVEFTLRNEAGDDLGLASMDSGTAFFFGPNTNRQLVMPLTSPNGQTVSPFDFAGRLQASSTSGKGSMSKVFLGATAVKESLTVQFTSTTAFTVTGSVSGALGSGTLPAATSVLPSGASISAFDLGAGLAANETIVVAFTTSTHFTVTGSVSGLFGAGDLPAATSASTRFTSTNLAFNVAVGSTALTGGTSLWNIGIFRGAAANPVAFAVVAGTSAFSATAPRPDRFYYEVWADAPSYSVAIPMDLVYEFLGDSTNTVGQTLTAGNTPVYYGRQQLWQATAGATTTTTTEDVAAFGRSVTVNATAGFLNNDIVVIEPLAGVGQREYVQIAPQRADGVVQASAPSGDPSGSAVKLNFKTPLRYAHAAGATITKVTLALRQEGGASNDYGLTPATGTITANVAFSAGVGIVMSYRTDARFGYWLDSTGLEASHVTTYVPPANDSSDIGEEQGDWQGLPYQDGTYTADLWLYKNIDLGLQNELQTYRSTSNAGTFDFLYGAATEIVPHEIISSSANCYTCHNDVIFHGGGRRGLDACLTCHSISGNEDKPRWDTPNQSSAAPTVTPTELSTGVAIEFRQMLHKIHKGAELEFADTYTVVGNGGNSSTYGEVEFPAWPGGVRQCIRCHGNDAWKSPSTREHASASVPVRAWTSVCGACHDSNAAHAHIELQTTTSGAESCTVCHGPGREWSVEVVHKPR